MAEGAPDRMDADRDGVPCETIYPEDYESFLNAAIGEGEGKLAHGAVRSETLVRMRGHRS